MRRVSVYCLYIGVCKMGVGFVTCLCISVHSFQWHFQCACCCSEESVPSFMVGEVRLDEAPDSLSLSLSLSVNNRGCRSIHPLSQNNTPTYLKY
jgi:hypothetical protein